MHPSRDVLWREACQHLLWGQKHTAPGALRPEAPGQRSVLRPERLRSPVPGSLRLRTRERHSRACPQVGGHHVQGRHEAPPEEV